MSANAYRFAIETITIVYRSFIFMLAYQKHILPVIYMLELLGHFVEILCKYFPEQNVTIIILNPSIFFVMSREKERFFNFDSSTLFRLSLSALHHDWIF